MMCNIENTCLLLPCSVSPGAGWAGNRQRRGCRGPVPVSAVELSSRSLRRREAPTSLSFPGTSISVVTQLQLDFDVDLVKNSAVQ